MAKEIYKNEEMPLIKVFFTCKNKMYLQNKKHESNIIKLRITISGIIFAYFFLDVKVVFIFHIFVLSAKLVVCFPITKTLKNLRIGDKK